MYKTYYYTIRFYQEFPSGNIPIKKWFFTLTEAERKIVGHDLSIMQSKWPIGMPLIRRMKPDLWELRSRLGKKAARIFFTIDQNKIVLLHGFIKKTQTTPYRELETAQRRLKIYIFNNKDPYE